MFSALLWSLSSFLISLKLWKQNVATELQDGSARGRRERRPQGAEAGLLCRLYRWWGLSSSEPDYFLLWG